MVNLNATTGSEMSFSTNPDERTELQEMKKRAEEAKLKIVTKIVEKRNKEKHEFDCTDKKKTLPTDKLVDVVRRRT